VDPPTI